MPNQGHASYFDQYLNPIPGRAPRATGGNPFSALLSSIGGGSGGGAGLPASAPAAPAGAGSRGYNAIFDPQAPGLLGLLGRLSGNPTRSEWLFERQGQSMNMGARGLADRIQGGMPPQQAVVDFINSPEGLEFFATVENPAEEIKRTLGLMVPEKADMINVAPGGTVFDPNSGQPVYNNPTTDVQDFTGIATLSNLPLEEIEKLAAAKLQSGLTGDMTQTERATSQMLQRGLIDADTMLKLNAGVLEFQPTMDATGRTNGYVLVDKSQPGGVRIIQPQQGSQQLPALPGEDNYAPGVRDDGYNPDARAEPGSYLQEFANPADIVEGVGPVPYLAEKGGGLLANLFGGQFSGLGAESSKKRRALDQIRNDARALKDSGRYLKSDLELLDSILPSTSSMAESPAQAAEALIQYNLWLDQRMAAATEIYHSPEATNEARGKARLELIDLEKAKMNVPPIDALKAKIQQLQTSPSPVVEGVREGAAVLGDAEREAERIVAPEAQAGNRGAALPEYDDPNVIAEHLRSGQLQYGSRIMFKGRPMRLDRTKPKDR